VVGAVALFWQPREIGAAAVYDTAVSADLIGLTAWRLLALEL
jgi:hypothetical protein